MKMTATWQEQGPGVVTITPSGIGLARLFGAPFAAAGGYFLYQFLGGVLHPGELTIAGWLLLPLMTAAFLVPGWIILFGRKRTRLDATRREATDEYSFLVYTRRVTTTIAREAYVMLRYEKGATRTVKGPVTDTSVTGFTTHVYLVTPGNAAPAATGAGEKLILLAMFPSQEKPAALAFAHNVARFLGSDVQDRCFEHGEVAAGGVVVDRLGPEDAD